MNVKIKTNELKHRILPLREENRKIHHLLAEEIRFKDQFLTNICLCFK